MPSEVSRRIKLAYEVGLPAHEAAVRLWMPMARTDPFQTVARIELTAPESETKSVTGGRDCESFHVVLPPTAEPSFVRMSFDIVRHTRLSSVPAARSDRAEPCEADLSADARVPVTGRVVEDALSRIRPDDSPRERARRIFQYVIDTFEYDGRGCTYERDHSLGDLTQACDLRRGTCTELHGVFVACARAAGVPARFIFGFNIPTTCPNGLVRGYHCWSEVFLPGTGWTPVDVSEALKREAGPDREFYFGGLDPNRIEFTAGRDRVLSPPQSGKPLDRFIFPYAESGGVPFEATPSISFCSVDA
jgi:transglutaminase-like putative cysteine protease